MHIARPVVPVILSIAVTLSAIACNGFYADVPTVTPGPEPTAISLAGTPESTGTRAEMAEAAARSALAGRLGIDPAEPSFAGLRGSTWTRSSPGCFPPPEGYDGEYLIPGLRLSLVYAGVRYEYNSDVPATTGALCDRAPQTPQEVDVSLADDVARTLDASRLAGRVVALADAGETRAFLQAEPGIAEIDVEEIDWTAEVLVGAALPEMLPAPEVTDVSASWDMNTNVVTIQVQTAPAGAPPEATGADPTPPAVWTLIEYPPAGAGFEFRVVPGSSGAGSP
ncbi:MAG: hypothetical protein HQ548_00285 [Chloroflexi bacterium]|nr:hypothetical protein [Chloroflexota bacterium]